MFKARMKAKIPAQVLFSNLTGKKGGGSSAAVAGQIRLVQSTPSDPKKPAPSFDNVNMDKAMPNSNPNPASNDKVGDVMSHSFGEGYATRSDEEGFGGVYSGNDADNIEADRYIHENHPAFDKTQGSKVAEKEKARNTKDTK